MKKLKIAMMMISLGLLFNCSPAIAEKYYASKPVVCGTMQEIVDMSSEFGELPIIKGEGTTLNDNGKYAPSQYFIGLNEKTGTWTLVELLSTGHACILGRGSKLEVLSKKKGIEL